MWHIIQILYIKKWTFGQKKWRFIQSGALIKSSVLFARIYGMKFVVIFGPQTLMAFKG